MKTRECAFCRENGREHKYTTQDCRAYPKQVTWNRKMRRIMAQDGRQPIPTSPDYSPEGLRDWAVSQSLTKVDDGFMANTWYRGVRALLDKEPKPMRGFTFMPKGEVS